MNRVLNILRYSYPAEHFAYNAQNLTFTVKCDAPSRAIDSIALHFDSTKRLCQLIINN